MRIRNFTTVLLSVIAAGALFVSCEYDDTELRDKINDHENRIVQLEELCSQMNTNISSLQTIVTALQANDYVTSIAPITSGDKTVGYTINFSKSGPVTIYHGENGKDGVNGADGQDGADGKDGHTPVVGVKMASDGNYCWTVDGEWLLDDDGNKIRANGLDGADGSDGANGQDGQDGADGKDGITPQLKIEDGYWYVSYDNGVQWTQLWKATGEDGKDGADGKDGDSMFSKVTYDDDFVYLVLADNTTTLMIPRKDDEFAITFTGGNELVCSSGETVSIPYTLTYGDSGTEVAAIPHGGWKATVEKTDNTSGNIIVTAPIPMKDGEVIILASDGNEKTIMRKLLFRQGVVSIVTKSYLTDSKASTIDVELSTNLNYTVSIPEDAESWISVSDIQTKAAMRNDIVTLNIAANINDATRTASVSFVNSANEVLNTIIVSQTGSQIANNEIWYISSDGNIIEPNTYNFAGTIVSNTYANGKGVIVFEDDLTEIWEDAFSDYYSRLADITVPETVTVIGARAFQYCKDLTEFTITNNITSIGEFAFGSSGLKKMIISESVKSIGNCMFQSCYDLEEVIILANITSIPYQMFQECKSLTKVNIPISVECIENGAFVSCSNLPEIVLPENVSEIEGRVFENCSKLASIYIKNVNPPTIDVYNGGLGISKSTKIYVPKESVELYKSGWSQYASQIVGYDFTE